MYIDRKMFLYFFFAFIIAVNALLAEDEEQAPDKNGVSPNTISLPEGPGSIEGLGESFKPMLNTGSAVYSINFELPAGTAGHQPAISLKYNSNKGYGISGIGWDLDLIYIARQTDKGLPRYNDDLVNMIDEDQDGRIDEPDEIDRFMDSDTEELVQLSSGYFRRKNENAFIRYSFVNNYWQAELKNGTKLYFGKGAESKVVNSALSNPEEQTYKWLLTKNVDTNGNTIIYKYCSFSDSGNQKYISEIHYGPGSGPWNIFYFVKFIYEDRPDWNKDYRSGYCIKTTKRLKEVIVGIQGVSPTNCDEGDFNNDGILDSIVRKYSLTYDDSYLNRSFLVKIEKIGSKLSSSGEPKFPPTTFDYNKFEPLESISVGSNFITCSNEPYVVFDNQQVDIVDLNSDSLPDLLKTDLGLGVHTAYLNAGCSNPIASTMINWSNPQQIAVSDGFAGVLSLADKKVHLADMDGNGRADLVYTGLDKQVSYHSNEGHILSSPAWGSRQYMRNQDTSPPSPFADPAVKTADLDFNKKIDIVKSTSNGYCLWLNLDSANYSREIRTPGAMYNGQVIQFSDSTVQLADINGDRMSDVVKITPSYLIYCANMGYGNFDTAVLIPIPDITLSSGTNSQISKAQLRDINGDGLADLVIERATVNQLWYWINLGTDSFSSIHYITNMPYIYNQDTAIRWADMNGNGTIDLVYGDSSASSRLRIIDIGQLVGGSGQPNLLKSIDNGLGAFTKISYKSSTDFFVDSNNQNQSWSSVLPFPVHVVDNVTTEVATKADDNEIYTTDYQYYDGYYDETEQEFRGFASQQTIQYGDPNAETSVVVSEFHTGEIDECLKGKVKKLTVKNDNEKVYNFVESNWTYKTLATGVDDRNVNFAYNNYELTTICEGLTDPDDHKHLLTRFEYDDYGNTILEHNFGIIGDFNDSSTYTDFNDEVLLVRQYIYDEINWILDRPLYEIITDPNGTYDTNNDIVASHTKYFYDDLAEGLLSTGNLTSQESWLDTESRFIPVLRNTYDDFGNIETITNANDHMRSIGYDQLLHTYPTTETVHLDGYNLKLAVDYHYGYGTIASAIDFSNALTTFNYDTLGRLKAINRPGGSKSEFDYHLQSPVSLILTKIHEDTEGNTFDSYAYFDGLGRELGNKTEAEDGKWTFTDAVSFNQRMQVRHKWLPYFTDSSDYELPELNGSDLPCISLDYDAQDRVVRTTNSDGTYSKTLFEPLVERQYDENDTAGIDTPKSLIYDGLERLIEVVERNADDYSNPEYHTSYQWTTLGDLQQITDAQNNIKMLAYDSLRRKTFMNDPDRGHMYYKYDDIGNLIWTKDAKSQEIVYVYDAAERLEIENYLDKTGVPATDPADVILHYDFSLPNVDFGDNTIGTGQNTLGRIAWVEDLSGQEHFNYDSRGNMLWNVKRIVDPKTSYLTSYKSSFTYDIMDRLKTVNYPDNDCLEYSYNEASQTETISGGAGGQTILSNIDYEPTGQLKFMAFGNLTSTTHDYDIRDRLKILKTIKQVQTELIHYRYGFDNVSNITSITDLRSFDTVSRDSARRNTQVFQYDDMYRLTQVSYVRKDNLDDISGQIDYSYDPIGNMKSKSSPALGQSGHIDDDENVNLGTFTYAGGRGNRIGRDPGDLPGPHALTGISNGGIYDYDANGNMANIEGAVCNWDYQDRLIRYEKGDTVADYTYDYSGRRITKKVTKDDTTTQTLYPNRVFEVRPNSAPVKYVFNGQSRIARVKGTLSPATLDNRIQRIWLYEGMNLVSLAVLTDENIGEIFQGSEVYTYNGSSYEPVPLISVPQVGEPLWVRSVAAKVIAVKGSYDDSVFSQSIPTGDSLIGWPRLEPFSPDVHIEGDFRIFVFDNYRNSWQMGLREQVPVLPAYLSNVPTQLDSACALWLKQTAGANITSQPTKPNDIVFYHTDHLGSSNIITDIDGNLLEETAFYPFGTPRNEYSSSNTFNSSYKYTGKELDVESSLQYFEARYLVAKVGRFASVDPLYSHDPMPNSKRNKDFLDLEDSQNINIYSYVHSKPLYYIDPSGLYDEENSLMDEMSNNFNKNMLIDQIKKYRGSELEYSKKLIGKINKMMSALEVVERVYNSKQNIDEGRMGEALKGFGLALQEVANLTGNSWAQAAANYYGKAMEISGENIQAFHDSVYDFGKAIDYVLNDKGNSRSRIRSGNIPFVKVKYEIKCSDKGIHIVGYDIKPRNSSSQKMELNLLTGGSYERE